MTVPRPCTVCAHLKRHEIDVLLARQVVNVADLGRTYGLNKDALRRHRERHLPGFLPAFAAQADGLVERQLMAEAQRLYLSALDNLARAEAGVLERVVLTDHETGERYVEHRPRVSTQAVARAIREARGALDGLVRLSGREAPAEHTEGTALGAQIREQLRRVLERRALDPPPAVDAIVDAVVVEGGSITRREAADLAANGVTAVGTQGLGAGRAGVQPPPPHSPETQTHPSEHMGGLGNPTHLPDGTPDLTVDTDGEPELTLKQITDAARAAGITPESLLHHLTRKKLPRVVHPEWTGNPAATKEERAAEGYADIEEADHRFELP